MRNLWVLIKNNLKIMLFKKPWNTLLLVVFPIIATLIISNLFRNTTDALSIGFIDKSNTLSSTYIEKSLKDIKGFNIKPMSEDEAKDAFINKEIYASIIINKDFENEILMGSFNGIKIQNLEGINLSEPLKSSITPEINNLINLAKVNKGDLDNYSTSLKGVNDTNINIIDKNINDLSNDFTNAQSFLGFLIMFILFRAMNGAFLITDDKSQNVYTRFMVASIKEWQYYLANITSTLIAIEVQIILTLLAFKVINPVNTGLTFFQMFIILSVVSILAVSLGTFCLTIVNSRDLSSILSNIFLMLFLFLGGCFVPAEFFPKIADKVSFFTPIRWAMESVSKIQHGSTLIDVTQNLAIVLGFAIVFFLSSVYRVKHMDKVNEY